MANREGSQRTALGSRAPNQSAFQSVSSVSPNYMHKRVDFRQCSLLAYVHVLLIEHCCDIPAQLTTKGQTDIISSYMHIMHVYIHNNYHHAYTCSLAEAYTS